VEGYCGGGSQFPPAATDSATNSESTELEMVHTSSSSVDSVSVAVLNLVRSLALMCIGVSSDV
jgi:hypothetical protein